MNKPIKRWAMLAVGTLIMILLGLIYAWSIFVAPLEAEFGWSRSQTSLTFTICMTFFVLGLLGNGFFSRRISGRVTLWMSAVLLFAGFGLCSRITTLSGLYIAYGVLVGFAVGIANGALVGTLMKWFPDRGGIASGILMMGFGMGGMILGSLATTLMRPESLGWRNTFLLFGIGFAAIIALGALAVKSPPPGYAESLATAPAQKKTTADTDKPVDLPAAQVLRQSSFWLYIAWFTLLMGGGLIVIGHAAPFVTAMGATGATAAVFTGILSLSNGIGRVVTGLVHDRLGLRKGMLFTCVTLILAAGLLILASLTGLLFLIVLAFILTGLSYGGGPTTSSTFSSRFYGMKHFTMNYAITSAGLIPAALLGPYLAGQLYTSSGGYLSSFITMFAFAVIALFFSRKIHKA